MWGCPAVRHLCNLLSFKVLIFISFSGVSIDIMVLYRVSHPSCRPSGGRVAEIGGVFGTPCLGLCFLVGGGKDETPCRLNPGRYIYTSDRISEKHFQSGPALVSITSYARY